MGFLPKVFDVVISPSRFRLVDGLSDVDVELLPRRNADEEAIPGNRFLKLPLQPDSGH